MDLKNKSTKTAPHDSLESAHQNGRAQVLSAWDESFRQVIEAARTIPTTTLLTALEKRVKDAEQESELRGTKITDLELKLSNELSKRDTIEGTRREMKLALEAALLKANEDKRISLELQETKHREANKTAIAEVSRLGSQVEKDKLIIDVAQKQAEDWKKQAMSTSNKMLPGEQGTAGEKEIELFLKDAFGAFMIVENVSKRGNGRELDLCLTTPDGLVHIRIDTKNYLGDHLPEPEIKRFLLDTASVTPRPSAAILFSKPPIRNITDKHNDNTQKTKRENIAIYYIGRWAKDELLGAIHDVIAHQTIQLLGSANAKAQPTGSTEVCELITEMAMLIEQSNKYITQKSTDATREAAENAARNKQVADRMNKAHAANAAAVPHNLLVKFEAQIPKPARGRPPKVESKQSVFADKKRKKPEGDAGAKKPKKS